ncbi:MAG: P27 family phage terminase small subunit [Chloroflexi bacterium]|nr:P27 family phage terminase small subunit [Chloroflexota bacterium]
MGLLTTLDMTALRLYCDSFETYTDAMRNIRECGTIIKTPKGFLMTSP